MWAQSSDLSPMSGTPSFEASPIGVVQDFGARSSFMIYLYPKVSHIALAPKLGGPYIGKNNKLLLRLFSTSDDLLLIIFCCNAVENAKIIVQYQKKIKVIMIHTRS